MELQKKNTLKNEKEMDDTLYKIKATRAVPALGGVFLTFSTNISGTLKYSNIATISIPLKLF